MVAVSAEVGWLQSRNAEIFGLAGVIAFSYALLKALKTFASLGVITVLDVMWGAVVLLVPVFALLGLYPRLREGSPRAALAAGIVTVTAGIAIVAIQLQLIITTLTMAGTPEIPGDVPIWSVIATYVVFVTLAVGFLFSAMAARRTDTVPHPVARLLLIPFLGWGGFIVAPAVLPTGDYLGLVVHLPISGALLAIGYHLGATDDPTGHTQASPDSTAR